MSNSISSIYINDLTLGKKEQLGGKNLTKEKTIDYKDGLSAYEMQKIDEDKDGCITEEEFKKAFENKTKSSEYKEFWGKYLNDFNKKTTTVDAAKAINDTSKNFGKVLDMLGETEFSNELKENLFTELSKALPDESSTIDSVYDFVDDFCGKYEIDDETNQNLRNALEFFANNKFVTIDRGSYSFQSNVPYLSLENIGKAVNIYSILSCAKNNDDINQNNFKEILNIIKENPDIETQAVEIKKLNITDYSTSNIFNILNKGNDTVNLGLNTLSNSLHTESINNALTRAEGQFGEALDIVLPPNVNLSPEVKLALQEKLLEQFETKGNIQDITNWVKNFVAEYNKDETKDKISSTTRTAIISALNDIAYNKTLSATDIGRTSTVMAIVSGLDEKDKTADNIDRIIEIVQKSTNVNTQANNLKKLNLEFNYNDQEILTILKSADISGDRKVSNDEYKSVALNTLAKSIEHVNTLKNVAENKQSDFGKMLRIYGVIIPLDTTVKLEEELKAKLEKENITDIKGWINDFASKNGLDKTQTKNLTTALNKIAYGKTLSIQDICNEVRAYAVLSGCEEKTAENLRKIRKEIESTQNIKEQASKIQSLGLSSSFSENDIFTILNYGNKDNSVNFTSGERKAMGLDILNRSILNTQNQIENGINGVNSQLDETYKQGSTGDCWLIAGFTALNATENGKEIIQKSIVRNNDGSVTVNFKGAGRSYTVTEEEIKQYDSDNGGDFKLSNGDNDMLVLELAFEKLRQDKSTETLDEGHGWEVYQALIGTETYNEDNIDKAFEDALNNPNLVLDFGLDKRQSAKTVDGKIYDLEGNHAYAITNVTEDTVTFINPWDSSNPITMTHEEFKKLDIPALGGINLQDVNYEDIQPIVRVDKGFAEMFSTGDISWMFSILSGKNDIGKNIQYSFLNAIKEKKSITNIEQFVNNFATENKLNEKTKNALYTFASTIAGDSKLEIADFPKAQLATNILQNGNKSKFSNENIQTLVKLMKNGKTVEQIAQDIDKSGLVTNYNIADLRIFMSFFDTDNSGKVTATEFNNIGKKVLDNTFGKLELDLELLERDQKLSEIMKKNTPENLINQMQAELTELENLATLQYELEIVGNIRREVENLQIILKSTTNEQDIEIIHRQLAWLQMEIEKHLENFQQKIEYQNK